MGAKKKKTEKKNERTRGRKPGLFVRFGSTPFSNGQAARQVGRIIKVGGSPICYDRFFKITVIAHATTNNLA